MSYKRWYVSRIPSRTLYLIILYKAWLKLHTVLHTLYSSKTKKLRLHSTLTSSAGQYDYVHNRSSQKHNRQHASTQCAMPSCRLPFMLPWVVVLGMNGSKDQPWTLQQPCAFSVNNAVHDQQVLCSNKIGHSLSLTC